ncbi:Tenascin-X [Galdieria sulphuraria]|nr:Tenascin-X [Galdieria sulphuraria]
MGTTVGKVETPPILQWSQLNVYSNNNDSFVPYGFPYENAIMNLTLTISFNVTKDIKRAGESCNIIFKKYQAEHIYSSKKPELLLPCGTAYSIQAYCSNTVLSNVVRVFIPCPLNGNYVISYTRGTAASNCLPGAVVLCVDLNQQGACSCKDDCILTKNCCPEVCSSQFCSLSLNIANMCNSISKKLSVPQVFETCPVGDGPSDSSCSEHGICSVEDGTCHCFAGYLPPDCSSRNNECTQNCYGDQGACVNGSCLCFAGYRGDGCRYRRCPQNKDIQVCSGNGNCDTLTGRCLCNIGCGGSKRSLSALNRAVTIPNWPLPVPKPEPVSREQAVIIFNEIIDFPIFNFTKEIWNMMAANLSRKIHVPRKNIFLVHFSKYQETNSHALQHQTLLDSCIQNSSCSIEKLTLESSQQGKTSIGVAVLTKVEDIYSTRVTIREYAMESITDQLNVTSRLNGNLVILSFNNGSQQPSKGKIAFLSVVAFFVLLFSSYISIFVLRNELREEKHNKKMWLTLPAAEEDSQAVLLEELILTGTKIDWLDADTNDPIQNKHMNVHQSTNNFSTTVSKNILRRRPLNQLTTTTAQ